MRIYFRFCFRKCLTKYLAYAKVTPNASPNAQNGLAQSGNLVMQRDAAVPRYGGLLFNNSGKFRRGCAEMRAFDGDPAPFEAGGLLAAKQHEQEQD